MSDLIHCITNPISMMQCANAVLALGDKPIMAEHPMEVKEITNTSSALLINLGNISDTRMEAMMISFEAALIKGLPIVLDAVGVACSNLRRNFVFELLKKYKGFISETEQKGVDKCNTEYSIENHFSVKLPFLVIKGNNAEIKALSDATYKGIGVDADELLDAKDIIKVSENLAISLNAIILCTGEKDIVTDGENTVLISNGTPMLGNITGTGCMLGAICASFLSKEKRLRQVAKACAFFGIAGEIAVENMGKKKSTLNMDCGDETKLGIGSFLIELLDAISVMDEDTIVKRSSVEYL